MWEYDWCRIEKPNAEVIHLLDDPLCIMLPRSHPLVGAKEVEISALANERWITRDGHYVAEVLTRYCRAAGFEPQIIYEASDYQEIQAMVAMDLGIAMVPGFALISLRRDVAVIRLGSQAPSRRVMLAHFGERANAPAARALCDLLVKTVRAAQSSVSSNFAVATHNGRSTSSAGHPE
jgi:DNA-binding transcriptional LysR family regulator